MSVLYRKYRPLTFAHVTNQRAVVQTLMNEIVTGHIGHAYCFSGPRGVGKTSIARIVARSLNCLNRSNDSAEPCNTCSSCQSMLSGSCLDLIEVDAASNTGVDHVRDNIIAAARVASAGGKKKIFIIDEAHMLSLSAFNALLKTLEEPPEHVVFILATTEIHKFPATILSRCQRFHFGRIASVDIVERLQHIATLEHRQVDLEVLQAIADQSDGGLRDAESLLGQVLSLETNGSITMDIAQLVVGRVIESDILSLAQHMAGAQASAAIRQLQQYQEDGGDPVRLLDGMIEFFRQALLAAQQVVLDGVTPLRKKAVGQYAHSKSVAQILRTLDIFIRRRAMIASSADLMLPLFMAVAESLLELPAPSAQPLEAFVADLSHS
ncbi:DNA polymerase III subunit gamma/tau [Candidatus Uhrbacteria bacterium]|nr:DNA polymerase III subunit gamma/tau [Candidatus Uhrbacteria bacterium]